MNLRNPTSLRRRPVRSRVLTGLVRRAPKFDFVEIQNDVREISLIAEEIEAVYRGPAEILPFSPRFIPLKKVSNL